MNIQQKFALKRRCDEMRKHHMQQPLPFTATDYILYNLLKINSACPCN